VTAKWFYWYSMMLFFVVNTTALHAADSSHTKSPLAYSWKNGFSLLDSGYISDGLIILDSMSRLESSNAENIGRFTNKIFVLLSHHKGPPSRQPVLNVKSNLPADTLCISSFKATLISRTLNMHTEMPSFSFGSSFRIDKPVQLIFDGLVSRTPPMLAMGRDIIYSGVDTRLTDQLDSKNDSINCTIFIDFSKQTSPVDSYLSERFSGIFDSVDFCHDLDKYNALSLRGYNRKNLSIENGKFTAILSFDKILPDRKRSGKLIKKKPLAVRYTIIVQSPGNVRNYAESKFQSLIRML
jgi:hypothetical protein